MKKLIAIVVFLLAAPALASGSCPASPGDIKGQIRCGELDCGQARVNSWYIGGGQCRHQSSFFCMVDCVPRMSSIESAEPQRWQILYPDGSTFDGLRNGKAVQLMFNGEVVDKGRFKDGFLTFKYFGRYLVLGGDLFLVER